MPTALSPNIPMVAGNYRATITPASESCQPRAWPSDLVSFGGTAPLIQQGNQVTLTVSGGFSQFDLSGTVSGDTLRFTISALSISPLFWGNATVKGSGRATISYDRISGPVSGEFFVAFKPLSPPPTVTCVSEVHPLILTRVADVR